MTQQINECVDKSQSFAFETTFSGRGYLKKINIWKLFDYEVIIYYLQLRSVDLAIERVRIRVAQGGHNVPEHIIRRRFERGYENFHKIYRHLADSWTVFDTSEKTPVIVEESEDFQ